MVQEEKIKIMVFGTFDLFHPGHKNFLKQAKDQGDCLIVVVARDKTVTELKKCKPANSEQYRLKKVKERKLADKVILGGLGDKYKVIKKYKPDVICLGYDQKYFTKNLRSKINGLGLKTRVIKLKPYKPEVYKSSKFKKVI